MALWTYPAEYNVTSFTAVLEYVNHITYDSFATLLCIALFVVVFVTLKNYATSKALSAAGFISVIIATLFNLLGLVSYYVIVVFVALTITGALYPTLTGEP